MTDNERRMKKAKDAIRPYAEFNLKTKDDTRTAMVDLIANLMHLAHAKSLPFDDIVQSAHGHFHAETHGE